MHAFNGFLGIQSEAHSNQVPFHLQIHSKGNRASPKGEHFLLATLSQHGQCKQSQCLIRENGHQQRKKNLPKTRGCSPKIYRYPRIQKKHGSEVCVFTCQKLLFFLYLRQCCLGNLGHRETCLTNIIKLG